MGIRPSLLVWLFFCIYFVELNDLFHLIRRRRICRPSFSLDSLWLKHPAVYGPWLLRAGPSEEERHTPRYTVPVSPQCPLETVLPNLPRPVFQGTAISYEHTSQFLLPGNVAELRCLQGTSGVSRAASSASSCWCAIPGYRTSRCDYTRDQSPETGSLSGHLVMWEPLPSVSCLAGSGSTSLVFQEDDTGLRTVASIGDFG